MKVKVSEATGPVLDWMVAKAAGLNPFSFTEKDVGQQRSLSKWVGINVSPAGHDVYCPSEDWSQGGPIIEREEIATRPTRFGWEAVTEQSDYYSVCRLFGPTALIAAMRCYVASKLGDEVDVPNEIV